jgi:anaerobic selenocysteine-containing dehydrogenase
MKEIIKTTCPRDCYDTCGIAVVKRDGLVRKVLGDPDHPVSRGALCGKCALAYNGAWRDPDQRLATPLRRSGAKGEGAFEPISWDEALAEVAERLKAEAETPERVLHTHYTGTCSMIAGGFPMRFFNRFGACEVDPDTICNNAGHVALDYVYGSSVMGFDPKTLADSSCIVVWGANPSASAPHAHKHWLKEAAAKVIVVDPVRHPTAEAADLHLQPFPGSDAALAFALMHVLVRDGRLDEDFLARHCLGWDELQALVPECTPAWGEAATGVSVADIEVAAALYGAGPAMLWLGQGLQRQARGGNVMRAAAMLPAITGNIGKPGAGIYYLNADIPQKIDHRYIVQPDLRRHPKATISHMDLIGALEEADTAKVLISWNMNVAASGPRQARLKQALAREDLFTVVIDLFATDTADYADIVLPAASFLEFDDLVTPYFNFYLSAQVKASDPPGEALPNQEIFRRLAAAMDYREPALFESDADIIEALLERTGLGINWADLKARGTIDPWPEPIIRFADLEFPTPSGKIELASARAEAEGHPRLPQPLADPRPAAGRLRLLSPAGPWQMNDSYGNDPAILEKLGPARVALNPADADSLGLAAGDEADLSNDTGRLRLLVALDATLPQGVCLAHKGRWAKFDGRGANVNVLNPGEKTDMGESSSVHGVEVEIAPARETI